MLSVLLYVCSDLIADFYIITQTNRENIDNIYFILNIKWIILIFYYYTNYKKKKNIIDLV